MNLVLIFEWILKKIFIVECKYMYFDIICINLRYLCDVDLVEMDSFVCINVS